jgi:hypothetical protein
LSALNSFAVILPPSIYTVRCNQGPRTASFTATRQRRAFLYNSAAKIGINQPSLHLLNTPAKRLNRKIRFTEPSTEMTRHENPPHCWYYITE